MEGQVEAAPSAEVAVTALMEVLVDPMLPLKPKVPSLEERQSVAKQMHAVVMLYNYYHRQQYPKVDFLDYKSFCKLVVGIRPVLSSHMNLANLSAEVLADDWGKQPSPAEKAIMDACNIASSLEAHGDVLNVNEWPLAKVSVLLVDSKKENCLLLFSSTTSGTWSTPEVSIDERQAKQSRFEHFAFTAIKNAKGIHMSKLAVLEKHVVYCLNKEKAAAYFFIMRCTDSSVDFQVPIKDAIESMEVPLLRWISDSWIISDQVVEYYDMLPYATIISSWHSRRDLSDGSECLVKGDEECGEEAILNDLEKSNVGLGGIDGNSFLLPMKSGGNEALTHDRPRTRKKNIKRPYTKRNMRSRLLTLEDLEKGNGNCRETISTDNTKLSELENEEIEKSSEPLKSSEPKKLGKCIDESLDITQTTEEILDTGTNLKETSQTTEEILETGTNLKETPGAVHSHSVETNAQDTNKSDKPWDCNGSEQYSPNDLQRIHSPARKKQKMDCHSMINLLMDESSEGVPTCVYAHLKQKIPLVSSASTTGAASQGGKSSLASVIAKREQALTKTALGVLYNKREKLVQQRRLLDSEIAQCDQNIHRILDGKEDSLAVRLDAVINGCKDMLQKDMTRYENYQNGRRDA